MREVEPGKADLGDLRRQCPGLEAASVHLLLAAVAGPSAESADPFRADVGLPQRIPERVAERVERGAVLSRPNPAQEAREPLLKNVAVVAGGGLGQVGGKPGVASLLDLGGVKGLSKRLAEGAVSCEPVSGGVP